MLSRLKVLQNNSRDFKTSLLYSNPRSSYLFACGDGAQRIFTQMKVKYGKIKTVFLPDTHPDYFTGFPGFFMTSRENNPDLKENQILELYGPAGIEDMMIESRFFIGNLNQINLHPYGKPEKSQSFIKRKRWENTDFMEDEDLRVDILQSSSNITGHEMLSYVSVPPQKRGKFLPEIATKLGCIPNQHFGRLCKGEQVILDNGTVVKPEEVLEPKEPSEGFVINFIPDKSYIPSTIKAFEKHFEQVNFTHENPNVNLNLIYHSTNSVEVFNDDDYLHLMSKFGPEATHIIDCTELNNELIARITSLRLAQTYKTMCPKLYPFTDLEFEDKFYTNYATVKKNLSQFNHLPVKLGMEYSFFRTDYGPDYSEEIKYDTLYNDINSNRLEHLERLTQEKFLPDSKYLSSKDTELILPDKEFSNEPEVTFLGTISMKPGIEKSGSAIYIEVPGKYNLLSQNKSLQSLDCSYGILMDCSEGTYGQLYDHYNDIGIIRQLLANLKCIFITHCHGDHHLGTLKILTERDQALDALYGEARIDPNKHKIYLVIPYFLEKWYKLGMKHLKYKELVEIIYLDELNPEPQSHYNKLFGARNQCVRRPHIENLNVTQEQIRKANQMAIKRVEKFESKMSPKVSNFFKMIQQDLKIKRILAIESMHCYEAYGCMIESDDWNIFYTGDTRPNLNHLQYGVGTTLLIHEATFEEDLIDEAQQKYHSTTTEAIKQGERMSVWRTCLTHFSPRYAKFLPYSDKILDSKAMLANDHLRLKLSDFEWAYKTQDLFRKGVDA